MYRARVAIAAMADNVDEGMVVAPLAEALAVDGAGLDVCDFASSSQDGRMHGCGMYVGCLYCSSECIVSLVGAVIACRWVAGWMDQPRVNEYLELLLGLYNAEVFPDSPGLQYTPLRSPIPGALVYKGLHHGSEFARRLCTVLQHCLSWVDNTRIGEADATLILGFLQRTFAGSRVLGRGHDSLRAGDAEHIPAGTCAFAFRNCGVSRTGIHLGIMFDASMMIGCLGQLVQVSVRFSTSWCCSILTSPHARPVVSLLYGKRLSDVRSALLTAAPDAAGTYAALLLRVCLRLCVPVWVWLWLCSCVCNCGFCECGPPLTCWIPWL